jgi:hypothetical protein
MDCLRIGQYRKTVELVVACAHLVRALSASKVTRRIFFFFLAGLSSGGIPYRLDLVHINSVGSASRR